MAGQTRIDGNLIDTGTDPNDIVSVSVGDGRYPRLSQDNTLAGNLTVDGDLNLVATGAGTGVFTIAAPDSNTNRTLTLPDEAGTVATIENIPPGYEDQDALDLFNATGSAPVYACRAWVNFDGTGAISIRGSGNVSSITDMGDSDYKVNFATAMPDNDYSAIGTSTNPEGSVPDSYNGLSFVGGSITSSDIRFQTVRWKFSIQQFRPSPLICLAVFR